MSRLVSAGRAAGAVGAALGVAAVGAAVGFAAERYVVGRSLRGDDPYAEEKFGSLRGVPKTVETTDGVLLHVEVDGDTSTSPLTVVFTHGYALNQDSWHFQRRDLAGRARLVFWDQRSHGRSGRAPEGSVTFERLAPRPRRSDRPGSARRPAGAGRPLDGGHDGPGPGRDSARRVPRPCRRCCPDLDKRSPGPGFARPARAVGPPHPPGGSRCGGGAGPSARTGRAQSPGRQRPRATSSLVATRSSRAARRHWWSSPRR